MSSVPMVLGLRPLEPIYASVDEYPGDKCGCCWSYLDRHPANMKWRLKFVNSSCMAREPGGPHYLIALRIAEAQRNVYVLATLARRTGTGKGSGR